MRRASTLLLATATLVSFVTFAEARREPRRGFVPMRGLTEARVDDAFDIGPHAPTRAKQRRRLPSFWAALGSPGSTGRGVHSSMFMTDQHYRWSITRLHAIDPRPVASTATPRGPKVIELRRPSTRPTTQPIIESITIR